MHCNFFSLSVGVVSAFKQIMSKINLFFFLSFFFFSLGAVVQGSVDTLFSATMFPIAVF